MDDIVAAGPPAPRPRRTSAVALVGAGLVGGMVLAGLSVANAQTDPTPSPSESAAPGSPAAPGAPGAHGRGFGKHRHGGPGMGLGRGVLHGEYVTENPDGGYRTMAVQRGEVTAVSATSISVRSADGFSRTYVVNGDTQVNANDEGIGDVSTGDTVHVVAVVAGDTATALKVVDETTAGRFREKWGPRRADPSTAPSTTPSEPS